MPYMNVLETYPLFDTVAVVNTLGNFAVRPNGWFTTFAAMGAANDIPFFNQRNVANAGIEYCNLETRDQIPWPFSLRKLNISFFAPSLSSQYEAGNFNLLEYKHTAIWQHDLPRHFGVEVSVNTDIRLTIAAMMPGAGSGPVAGGYGQLASHGDGNAVAFPQSWDSGSQGVPDRRNGFVFPYPVNIEIPAKAAISVTLKPSEYARRLLQGLAGPYNIPFQNTTLDGTVSPGAFFGIRVTMHGIRGVQQRGEAHAR